MTDTSHKYEIFLLILITAFIGVFVYTVHGVLSPILLLTAVIILMLPLRRHPAIKTVLSVVLLIFLVWFFDTLSSVLAPVFIAALLAYILDPLIDVLMRFKMSRLPAAIIVMLSFIAVAVLAVVLVVPAIIHSFRGFNPQAIGGDIYRWVGSTLVPWLVSFGISESDIRQSINTKVLPHIESMLGSLVGSLSNVALGLTAVLGQLANAVIIPILMFYILLDWSRIKSWVMGLFPPMRRAGARRMYKKIDAILSAYLRGAITIAIINSIVVTTFFIIFGLPFAVVLGILSGLLTLIPQFGVLITMAISSLICLFGPSPGVHILVALPVLLGENLLESSILYPKIVGNALGLHPAALIISLLIFAYFLGFIGMLVAVPVTSLIGRFLEEWLENRDLNSVPKES